MKVLPPFTEEDPPDWLLSFDFDGTLVHESEQPMIQPRFFEIVESMRESHRALWGINTGRSLMFTLEGMLEAKFPILPDFIIAREREIYVRNEFGRWIGVEPWNINCEKAHHVLFKKQKRLLKRLRKWVEKNTKASWGEQDAEPAGIVATGIEEMNLIVRMIDQEIASDPSLSYQWNTIYLRFSHSEYHKGSALSEVARMKEISPDRIFTIGDGHNDVDMLDLNVAKYIACPGNAHGDIKKHVQERGGIITQGEASYGVIEALVTLSGEFPGS